jgi:hypothetical protein
VKLDLSLQTLAENLAKHPQPSLELLLAALEKAYIRGWDAKAAEVRQALGIYARG